jgi:hypothetical protein
MNLIVVFFATFCYEHAKIGYIHNVSAECVAALQGMLNTLL